MTLADLEDDTPITLKEACEVFFRNTLTPDSLRAERARGNLPIMRIGKRDFVTPAGIRGMMSKKCLSEGNQPASTSTPLSASGSSETARTQNAQDAARTSAEKLKRLSKPTLPANSNRPSAKVVPLGSRSPKS
ncbi:hypothetical protein PRN20_04410 [Devosia sp. ZB163]|uniref:hypothetical protein n=1 Tax=Devosia sp. ZB163 TaxID=3025938 RepID=UPI0023606FC3|nr:hypothetical protein [Devosia sp. ZB163]MDC9822964.1 hypothetical protein [Devosia sp. ZB163]